VAGGRFWAAAFIIASRAQAPQRACIGGGAALAPPAHTIEVGKRLAVGGDDGMLCAGLVLAPVLLEVEACPQQVFRG
jgi:hypothetical protein